MGFWKTERGISGDSWADALGDCMHKLAKLKTKPFEEIGDVILDSDNGSGHEITIAEFADLIEFCSCGHIIADVRDSLDSRRALSQLCKKGSKTYSNRGQIQWGTGQENPRPQKV